MIGGLSLNTVPASEFKFIHMGEKKTNKYLAYWFFLGRNINWNFLKVILLWMITFKQYVNFSIVSNV